jgi:hypothetical protein
MWKEQMSLKEAREVVIGSAWAFIQEKEDGLERPNVLYKFISFDSIVTLTLSPLKEALERLDDQLGQELLPQKAILMRSLLELKPILANADGRVRPIEQVMRDRSILLLDEITAELYYRGGMANYFDRFFEPGLYERTDDTSQA